LAAYGLKQRWLAAAYEGVAKALEECSLLNRPPWPTDHLERKPKYYHNNDINS
jgi:hypothetical protein